jgi:hypothetical protein
LARYFAAIPAPYEPYFEKEMVQDSGFTEEQKQYLEGFLSAIAKKRGLEMPTASASIPGNAQLAVNPLGEEQKRTRHIFIYKRKIARH